MPVDTLLQLAEGMTAQQLKKADGLAFEALLLYLDVLVARDNIPAAIELLDGPCGAAVQLPHELLRLKVRVCWRASPRPVFSFPIAFPGHGLVQTRHSAVLDLPYVALEAESWMCVQAQLAMAAKDWSKAARYLEVGIRQHTPDDWAGYQLLMACRLPGTALPFDEAVDGVFELQGGFAQLSQRMAQEDFWAEAKAQCSEADVSAAVTELEKFVAQMVSHVRPSHTVVAVTRCAGCMSTRGNSDLCSSAPACTCLPQSLSQYTGYVVCPSPSSEQECRLKIQQARRQAHHLSLIHI